MQATLTSVNRSQPAVTINYFLMQKFFVEMFAGKRGYGKCTLPTSNKSENHVESSTEKKFNF